MHRERENKLYFTRLVQKEIGGGGGGVTVTVKKHGKAGWGGVGGGWGKERSRLLGAGRGLENTGRDSGQRGEG